MAEIAHPHDRFLKRMLSDPEKAGILLRERLPRAIAELLADEPPELVPGTFVDKTLREHFTDRLFAVKTIKGQQTLLYALIDHKSAPERKVGWQLLRYMVKVLEQWAKDNPNWKRMPPIVPLVFYNGASEWRVPNEFLALVDADEGWRPYLLNFQFQVFDLGNIPDQNLSRHPSLRVWLAAAKYATRKGQQLDVKEFLVEVLTDAGEDFPVIIRYMMETYQSFGEETFREIIRRVKPEEEAKMMSQFAQEIIAKGKPEWIQMGRQEGRQEGEAALLLRLLQKRFGPVPNEVTERVRHANQTTLETWGDRVLDAGTMDEVFAE